jgi:hypothetical protein
METGRLFPNRFQIVSMALPNPVFDGINLNKSIPTGTL